MNKKWVLPCNLRMFDLITYLENNDSFAWKKSASMMEGDYVYIYVGSPYSQILYKCVIVNDGLRSDELKEYQYLKTRQDHTEIYMKLNVLVRIPLGTMQLQELKEHGLRQFQRPSYIAEEVENVLTKRCKEKGIKWM